MMPAASAGETFDKELGRSIGLEKPKLLEVLAPGVVGREELGVLTVEGEYHDSVAISPGRG